MASLGGERTFVGAIPRQAKCGASAAGSGLCSTLKRTTRGRSEGQSERTAQRSLSRFLPPLLRPLLLLFSSLLACLLLWVPSAIDLILVALFIELGFLFTYSRWLHSFRACKWFPASTSAVLYTQPLDPSPTFDIPMSSLSLDPRSFHYTYRSFLLILGILQSARLWPRGEQQERQQPTQNERWSRATSGTSATDCAWCTGSSQLAFDCFEPVCRYRIQ